MNSTQARVVHLYALPLSTPLPGNLPHDGGYPFVTEDSDEWYAVVEVTEDEARIVDVRRVDWELPKGAVDWRQHGR